LGQACLAAMAYAQCSEQVIPALLCLRSAMVHATVIAQSLLRRRPMPFFLSVSPLLIAIETTEIEHVLLRFRAPGFGFWNFALTCCALHHWDICRISSLCHNHALMRKQACCRWL
jgi:hypothetical protein